MISANQLWQEARRLKQEILDLKQAKKAGTAAKYFISSVSYGEEYYSAFKITYKDGTQPIVTEALSSATTAFSSPSNNIQYLFVYSQTLSTIAILSTREIESIEGVSAS